MVIPGRLSQPRSPKTASHGRRSKVVRLTLRATHECASTSLKSWTEYASAARKRVFHLALRDTDLLETLEETSEIT
jgi:hypothetical protein